MISLVIIFNVIAPYLRKNELSVFCFYYVAFMAYQYDFCDSLG
jgi:hypothetical protein